MTLTLCKYQGKCPVKHTCTRYPAKPTLGSKSSRFPFKKNWKYGDKGEDICNYYPHEETEEDKPITIDLSSRRTMKFYRG